MTIMNITRQILLINEEKICGYLRDLREIKISY